VLNVLGALPRFVGSDLVFTTTGTTPIFGFGRVKNGLDTALGISAGVSTTYAGQLRRAWRASASRRMLSKRS
jgi:hypothetical protein